MQAGIDVTALQSPTPSSIQLNFSKKLPYLESQISCIALQVTELPKSHCISHCGGGFTHPENCIQRLLDSLENFPLISRGSDFVKNK